MPTHEIVIDGLIKLIGELGLGGKFYRMDMNNGFSARYDYRGCLGLCSVRLLLSFDSTIMSVYVSGDDGRSLHDGFYFDFLDVDFFEKVLDFVKSVDGLVNGSVSYRKCDEGDVDD